MLVLVDSFALITMKIRLEYSALGVASFIIAYLLFSYAFIKSSVKLSLNGKKLYSYVFRTIGRCFEALSQLAIFLFSSTVLVYIASASPRPLYDEKILSIDRWLGMDIIAWLSFVNQYSYFDKILQYSYLSFWQIPLLLTLLIIFKESVRMYSVFLCLIISVSVCAFISAIFPAIAPYPFLGLTASDYPNVNMISGYHHVDDFFGMRNGTLKTLDLYKLKGIITFPSAHACIAVILLWGFWRITWLRWPFFLLNVIALISIPITGGHYLTDMIFGAIIGIATIYMVKRIVKFSDAKIKFINK